MRNSSDKQSVRARYTRKLYFFCSLQENCFPWSKLLWLALRREFIYRSGRFFSLVSSCYENLWASDERARLCHSPAVIFHFFSNAREIRPWALNRYSKKLILLFCMKVLILVGKVKIMLFFYTMFSNSETLENEMQKTELTRTEIWNPAILGIRNPMCWNPESRPWNLESTERNPESVTVLDYLTWGENHVNHNFGMFRFTLPLQLKLK